MDSSYARLHFVILLCVVLWGTSYVAIKIALVDFEPIQLAVVRFNIASACLIPILIVRKSRVPSFKLILIIIAVSCVGIVAYQIALNYALVHYSSSFVSFVSNSLPIFVSIIGFFFLSENQGRKGWIGLLLGLLGIFIMNMPIGSQCIEEILILLICPISAAIFYVLQKPLMKHIAAAELMMYEIICGAVVLTIIDYSFFDVVLTSSSESLIAAIYLGVIPTALAFMLWTYVLRSSEVTYASGFIFLIPVSTIVVAYLYFGTVPSFQEWIGGGLILLGIKVLRKTRS